MASATSASFCFLFCFLVCSSKAQKIIRAELGQNATLPCKVPNNINIKNILAVEWSRHDQYPEYVLSNRDGRFDPEHQLPSYQNRVDLPDKEMKDGNVSLILKSVMMEDTGTYECRVFEKGKNEPISNITLRVLSSALTNITTEKAYLGKNVILPCKVPSKYNIKDNKIAVEWNRLGMDPEYILLYRNRYFDPYNQHPSYQNRVDLQDKEKKDGNFSLILKNVTMNDTGTYECRVFEEGKNELISIINLEVHPSGDQDRNIGDGGETDGGNKNGIIVGSVVGVILLLLAVASVGFLIYRHMRQNRHRPVPPVEPPVQSS